MLESPHLKISRISTFSGWQLCNLAIFLCFKTIIDLAGYEKITLTLTYNKTKSNYYWILCTNFALNLCFIIKLDTRDSVSDLFKNNALQDSIFLGRQSRSVWSVTFTANSVPGYSEEFAFWLNDRDKARN